MGAQSRLAMDPVDQLTKPIRGDHTDPKPRHRPHPRDAAYLPHMSPARCRERDGRQDMVAAASIIKRHIVPNHRSFASEPATRAARSASGLDKRIRIPTTVTSSSRFFAHPTHNALLTF